MRFNLLLLFFCLFIGCSNKYIESACESYKPTLFPSLELYDSLTPVIQVRINGQSWQDWGNGTNLTKIDNPVFFQVRPNIRYQRCKGQGCAREIGEFIFIKSQGVSLANSVHLESFQFRFNLPDSVVASLRLSKRGQLIYTPENILENDQVCTFKEEIISLLLEDDEYYGRYRIDSSKAFSFALVEFKPEQQVVAVQFTGSFFYDKTDVDPALLPKANRLYESNINVQIYSRFRYLRLNES